MAAIDRVSERLPVVFPVHPRTRDRLAAIGDRDAAGVRLIEPLPLPGFLGADGPARLRADRLGRHPGRDDALGVPCLTLRDNTERPITVSHGTNRLVGPDPTRSSGCL